MSVLLRDAVRALLRDVEDQTTVDDRSALGRLRHLIRLEERAERPLEPAIARETDRRIAQLVEALERYKKPGGHFIGCPADRQGHHCSDACRLSQAALNPDAIVWASNTVAALLDTIDALEKERRSVLLKLRALERPPGRPRKNPLPTGPITTPIERSSSTERRRHAVVSRTGAKKDVHVSLPPSEQRRQPGRRSQRRLG